MMPSAPFRLLLAGSTVMAIAAAVACGPPPATPVKHNIEKVKQEREPDKLVARGKAFAQMGDLTRAEQYFASAMEQGADPDEVMPLLLRICIESGRFRVGIDHARNHLKVRPDNVALRFLLGSMLQAVGEIPAAREQLERVVSTEPEHADAHYSLAVIARDHEGDLMRADRHFREYLRLRPDGPYADEARSSLLESVP
ncbi:MAG: hypothetical protein CVU63_08870 [Deltaproteobacteria bacterium HGW-Deltaproteobacteria-20]|nr:MAG: hypothetical protein CVU63_08870 [Deltaproteobacteria bacterium HGW-Deltaproteobacteria-20]